MLSNGRQSPRLYQTAPRIPTSKQPAIFPSYSHIPQIPQSPLLNKLAKRNINNPLSHTLQQKCLQFGILKNRSLSASLPVHCILEDYPLLKALIIKNFLARDPNQPNPPVFRISSDEMRTQLLIYSNPDIKNCIYQTHGTGMVLREFFFMCLYLLSNQQKR